MKINITGKNIDISESMKKYVDNKFHKLEKHTKDINSIHITCSIEKSRQKIEAIVHVNKAKIFANHEHEDMYSTIDGLVVKLEKQLQKHKQKLSHHKK